MTIGGSIALIILGAILAFAVEFEVAGIDITTIGYILMLGGLIGMILGLVWWQRANTRTTTTARRRPVEERTTVVEDRDVI